ncbi:MAG TPA: hypothetical protein PKA05_06690 [Roseiflexaceae bacterium]|nr:hypothetical protein [Roseiflexaceae bacterium]
MTRVYLEGSTWEEQTGGGPIRTSYMFNGQVVAQRDSTGGAPVVYLHGDHLGSVGFTSSTGGALRAVQEFDPWGTVRSGASSATLRNYTGVYWRRAFGTILLTSACCSTNRCSSFLTTQLSHLTISWTA